MITYGSKLLITPFKSPFFIFASMYERRYLASRAPIILAFFMLYSIIAHYHTYIVRVKLHHLPLHNEIYFQLTYLKVFVFS